MAVDSKIILKCDINSKEWTYTHSNLCFWYADVHIGFFDNNSDVVDLRELNFGYELRQNNRIKYYSTFPRPGGSYLSTDQEFIEVERIDREDLMIAGARYELTVWTEHKGTRKETTFGLTLPAEVPMEGDDGNT